MQIRFAEKGKSGFIATLNPIEYTTDANKALVKEIDIFNFTDTDIKASIIDPIKKILEEVDSFNIYIYFAETVNNSAVEMARIEFDGNSVGLDASDTIDPDLLDQFKHLASDISMYGFELLEVLATKMLKKTMPTVSKMIQQTMNADSSEQGTDTEVDEEALIESIQQRTKADIVKPSETLDDYMCDSVLKEELLEIKDFFEREADYKNNGIITPKGILLKGKPGTGKTYAARCIAGSVNCWFMTTTASALQGQYIGSGAENVRLLFKGAKALREQTGKGVIIFIDELDSFGSRATRSSSSSGEEDRTLNQLLAELSGFTDSEGIMVMGATNYPDRIDDALMRAGRFSRQITIRTPERNERQGIVAYYYGKIKLPLVNTDIAEITELTEGLTPADIKEISNESAILAMRQSKSEISIDEVNEAVNKVITKNIRTPDGKLDVELVSAHEAGHVLAAYIYNNSIAIKVTSYSYGDAGGFTQPSEYLDGLFTSGRLLNEVRELVAGRAAEQVYVGCVTNGASNDFEKVKHILRTYYTVYHFEKYDEEKIDQLIQDKLNEIYEEVVEEFKFPQNKALLDRLTKELVSRRVLYAKDISAIVMKGMFI
jgi:ATP-dependent Zn protease